MSGSEYPEDFIKLLKSIKAKRPKTVIDHILENGQITTQELKETYGYNHPPRAIRDVREQGIPIETFRVMGTDGRKIAAYRFGDPAKVRYTKLSGRTAFNTKIKGELIERYGCKCNIYLAPFPERELQIDHRIPFEIDGDSVELSSDINDYMLLCASANRAKSWSCENCKNWVEKSAKICATCYWASPEDYSHIATREIRRLDILWSENETRDFEDVRKNAVASNENMPDYVKNVLRERHRRPKSG